MPRSRSAARRARAAPQPPATRLAPVQAGAGERRLRVDRLLDGRLEIAAPRALEPMTRLLIEAAATAHAANGGGRRVLTLALPDSYAAMALRALEPGGPVEFYHYDLFHVRRAAELARQYGVEGLVALCAPDVPVSARPPDLVLAAFRRDDEAGLTCELLRQAAAALAPGGKLLAATNNPRDQWLARQLERTFGNLSMVAGEKSGRVYAVKNTFRAAPGGPPQRFIRTVEVRFGDLSLDFDTCYGTFSMGGLDEGSRALLEKMQPPEPCRAVLDLGCGWGAVGLIAARLLRPERLTMIDANARAVEMARRNAIRLGIGDCRLEIENQDRERHQASGGQDAGFQSAIRDPQSAIAPGLDVRLESDAESLSARDELGSYDLVLTNPPYATDFRVTERFIQVARFALRLGGRAFFVGKPNERLPARIDEVFGNHEIQSRRGYAVVSAVRRD